MKIKLMLLTIIAALAVSADSKAMLRRAAPVRVAAQKASLPRISQQAFSLKKQPEQSRYQIIKKNKPEVLQPSEHQTQISSELKRLSRVGC